MTKKSIIFATTSLDKIREAKAVLTINVIPSGLEIPEIQSLNPQAVAVHKAQSYFAKLKKPLLIEDVSLSFATLNGLPGPYINDFSKSLGNAGLIKLLSDQSDRSAVALTTLIYCDAKGSLHEFQGEIKGTISQKPLGDNGFGWDPIFIPNGHTKTFAQMTDKEKNSLSMRAIALHKFKSWLSSHPS